MESDNRRKEMLINLANEVVNMFVTLQLWATFNFQDDRVNAYVEPMIFRFHQKPKRNLGFEAELPVRT